MARHPPSLSEVEGNADWMMHAGNVGWVLASTARGNAGWVLASTTLSQRSPWDVICPSALSQHRPWDLGRYLP